MRLSTRYKTWSVGTISEGHESLSPPARIQATYDSEFGKAFGPLAALAVVHQNQSESEKSRIINDFAAALRIA
jgi:hypothetical protein